MSHPETITDFKSLARVISLVENEAAGFQKILQQLSPGNIPVIGITGPPGAGKSTLLNAITGVLLEQKKKLGLILVDPSSPFNLGALLGDRLRMSGHFTDENVFIRSIASRGSLGGLSDTIIEVVEAMRGYPFDYIFIETVGVGQSEVEIAGLADTTVVVLMPESGDGVQTMKAGLMEIADIFVVNKADRAGADALVNSISMQLQLSAKAAVPIFKTISPEGTGVKELLLEIEEMRNSSKNKERRLLLLAEKALRIIAKNKMKNFDRQKLLNDLKVQAENRQFNLYQFLMPYL